jgi:hypothetical protein
VWASGASDPDNDNGNSRNSDNGRVDGSFPKSRVIENVYEDGEEHDGEAYEEDELDELDSNLDTGTTIF